MTKKPSLSAALHEASGKKALTPIPTAQEPAADDTDKTARPSRQQTKLIGGHFDPIISRQLRQLALDESSTVQALLAEALNDLFVKYGRKPLA
ncbi:MAG: ribbon-helix-helix domain-containing protein [Chloroflexales bacterium]